MSKDLAAMFAALDDSVPKARQNDYLRLPFAYPGSKYKSLDKILPELPYRKAYAEPFGGSGAVLLARVPSSFEVYNDRYGGVVALMRCLRDSNLTSNLIQRLEGVLHSREEWTWCAQTWESCQDDVERAARWYYMMIFSFSSVGRNFGRAVKGTNSSAKKYFKGLPDFYPCHNRLRHVLIENLDWYQCIRDFDDEGMVWYLDPPYLDTDVGTYSTKFGYNDHVRLLEVIDGIKGFVAISGYNNSLYNGQKFWTRKIEWDVRTTVNHNDRENVHNQKVEVLWIKDN
jgi:DNA adenine methylase